MNKTVQALTKLAAALAVLLLPFQADGAPENNPANPLQTVPVEAVCTLLVGHFYQDTPRFVASYEVNDIKTVRAFLYALRNAAVGRVSTVDWDEESAYLALGQHGQPIAFLIFPNFTIPNGVLAFKADRKASGSFGKQKISFNRRTTPNTFATGFS